MRRPWVAAAIVVVAYAILAMLNSTGGYLGTDTGAKVITLDRMVERDTFSPAVGYWAEEWDPHGAYHPLFDTRQNDDGEWINVTTLPMLLASRPLYEVGGYRLALALPIAGALLAAFACRDIARQLGGDRAGWWSFWVAAFASPIAIYALDFWEHSLGAGLMLGANALLLRIVHADDRLILAAAAGLAFGLSATMRTETFAVAVVAVGTASLALVATRRVGRAVITGALAVAGFAGPWVLNGLIEGELGGNSRAARAASSAGRSWWTEVGERSEEALITWFALPNVGFPDTALLGAVAAGALLLAVALRRRGEDRPAVLAVAVAAVIYGLCLASGLGFVAGAFVASPFAVGAALVGRDRPRVVLAAAALVMTVLIWLFQYTGGAGPQWGGRYLLVPTLLLTTLGVVALVGRDDRFGRRVFAGFAVVVTAFGLLWLNQRSHDVEAFFEDLASQPEDVVISTNGFLVREAGPAYAERLYLSLGRGSDLDGAVEVVRRSGRRTFAVLTAAEDAPELDAEYLGSDTPRFLGVELSYHRYRIDPDGAPRDGR